MTKRFGNPYLITNKIIDNLKTGPIVNTAPQLQRLADELSIAEQTLSELNLSTEIDNQRSFVAILQRCPRFVKHNWQRKALDDKHTSGSYPAFKEFSKFMTRVAADSLDPLYGYYTNRPKQDTDGTCYSLVTATSRYNETSSGKRKTRLNALCVASHISCFTANYSNQCGHKPD